MPAPALRWIASLLLLACWAATARAQIPPTYYNSANLCTSTSLRRSLNQIISYNTTVVSYSNSSASFAAVSTINASTTDPTQVVVIYGNGDTRLASDHTSNGDPATGGINREHTFCQSFYNDANPMASDLFMLLPADAEINGAERGNKYYDYAPGGAVDPFGNRYTSTIFEPNNGDKGNCARCIFYMDVRYEATKGSEPDLVIKDSGSVGTGLNTMRQLSSMLTWNANDPPDAFERLRNQRTYLIQGNGNPFIEHPEWVGVVYDTTPQTISPGDAITLNAANRLPGLVGAGTTDIPALMTTATLAGSLTTGTLPTHQWDIGQLTVQQLGTAADSDIAALKVWLDADGDGVINRVDPLLTSATLSGGVATLNLATPFRLIPGKRALLLTTSFSTGAVPGKTVQLSLNGIAHRASGGSDIDPSFSPFATNTATIAGGGSGAGAIKIVMVSSRAADNGASKEFVALFNQSAAAVSLSGWKLLKKSGAGSTATLTLPIGASVEGYHPYIIASQPYAGVIPASYGNVTPDMNDTGTSGLWGGISDTTGCSIGLYDSGNNRIDAVSFNGGATAPDTLHEGTAFTGGALSSTKSIARKNAAGIYIDTDDNSVDLEVLTSKDPPQSAVPPAQAAVGGLWSLYQ